MLIKPFPLSSESCSHPPTGFLFLNVPEPIGLNENPGHHLLPLSAWPPALPVSRTVNQSLNFGVLDSSFPRYPHPSSNPIDFPPQ